MNFPNLPTDNLYKFLTFSALLMIGFSIWYPSANLQKVLADQSVRAVQISSAQTRDEDLKRLVAALEKRVAEKEAQAFAGKTVDVSAEKEDLANIMAESKALVAKIDELEAQNEAERVLVNHLQDNATLFSLMSYAGFVLLIVGLGSWYYLHQRYQDMLLKKQAVAKDSEPKTRKTSS